MKRDLLLLSLLALALSVLGQDPNGENSRDLPNQYWRDLVTEQPEGYVVDANGDVHIYTAEAMAWLVSLTNGLNGQEIDHFEGRTVSLEDNVDLSGALWLPIAGKGDVPTVFQGNFDGKGHLIEGLTMTNGDVYYYGMGLFGTVSGATLSNIILKDGYYEAQQNMGNCGGGFLANTIKSGSHIDRCFVECEMHIESDMSPFVNSCESSTISNSMVHCPLYQSSIPTRGIPGILVNRASPASSIYNCASIIEQMSWSEHCGLAGADNYGRIENCYSYIGVCLNFPGYGGGPGPRNGITESNSGEIYNCYYNRLRDAWGNYVDLDDQPASENYGIIQDVLPYTDEGLGHWKLAEAITFLLNGETVSTDDLLDALSFNTEILGNNGYDLLSWCDSSIGFSCQQLPVFCDMDVTEIEDQTAQFNGIKLYPNPTSGLVQLEGAEAAEMRVYNALGQLVKTVRGTNEIDLSGLAEGVYLLRITDVDGRSHVARVAVKR